MRPASRVLALAATVVAVACFELSGPPEGVASISSLIAPSSAVAEGDLMRDSLAQPAPLRIFAFDGNGDTLGDAPVRFIVLDAATSVDATGQVRGLSLTNAAGSQIVGRVGDLQTPVLRVHVVPVPLTVEDVGFPSGDTIRYAPQGDTVLAPIGIRILNGSTGVPFWPVRIRIASTTVVSQSPAVPAVRLVRDDNRTVANSDTTDQAGLAQLRLQIIGFAMPAERRDTLPTDVVNIFISTVVGSGASATTRDTTVQYLIRPRPRTP